MWGMGVLLLRDDILGSLGMAEGRGRSARDSRKRQIIAALHREIGFFCHSLVIEVGVSFDHCFELMALFQQRYVNSHRNERGITVLSPCFLSQLCKFASVVL